MQPLPTMKRIAVLYAVLGALLTAASAQNAPAVAGVEVGMSAAASADALTGRGFEPGGAPLPEIPGPSYDALIRLMVEGADGFSAMLAPALSIKSGEPVAGIDFNDPANVAPWKRFYQKGEEEMVELEFLATPSGPIVKSVKYAYARPALDRDEAAALVQSRYGLTMSGRSGSLKVDDGEGGEVRLRASFNAVPQAHLRLELENRDLARRNAQAIQAAVKAARPDAPPSF